MNEVSHLATDKDIVTMLTAIIGAICLVIGGTIGFFTKYFYENKKINESKKALRQQMITNNIAPMRQAWINDVRGKISEIITLHGYTNGLLSNDNDIELFESKKEQNNAIFLNLKRIILLTNQLKLLLPKNEIEYSELIEMIDAIANSVFNHELSAESIAKINNDIIEKTRTLLKKEWEVTKSLKEIE